ncbi:DUF7344 domain-containing protein [Halorussus halophilus]|uniref:DUF7344 domain-containing protein n=1 Tax=Halorussus halophilus TaxID=2650975 RepID=UPI001300E5A3|nr:transcriptional regulator [Halorussus halophilus]
MNDNAFTALANERRRTLLLNLLASNPQDAGVESSTGESVLTDAAQRAQTEMYHVHLPKLEDYGYIAWDKDANEVVKGPQFHEIRPLLEFLASNSPE